MGQLLVPIPAQEAGPQPVNFPYTTLCHASTQGDFCPSQHQPLSHQAAELVCEPTPHFTTPLLLLMFLLKCRRWPEGPCLMGQQGKRCLWHWEAWWAEGPGDEQGSWGHFRASPPSHRPHACLNCKSPHLILFRAAPVFMICIRTGLSESEMQSCSFRVFIQKQNTY